MLLIDGHTEIEAKRCELHDFGGVFLLIFSIFDAEIQAKSIESHAKTGSAGDYELEVVPRTGGAQPNDEAICRRAKEIAESKPLGLRRRSSEAWNDSKWARNSWFSIVFHRFSSPRTRCLALLEPRCTARKNCKPSIAEVSDHDFVPAVSEAVEMGKELPYLCL